MSADNPTYHAIAPRLPFKPFPIAGAPSASPLQFKSLAAKRQPVANRMPLDPAVMREARTVKRAAWATLDLRQHWADAAWLRAHLTAAGLRVTVSCEPATALRMKAKLRSIGIHSPEVQAAVGMSLTAYLKSNPRLPLWAALALVLEATGRFTPDVVVAV
jgi:hypothetical protein